MEQQIEVRETELSCACTLGPVALHCPMDPLVCYMTEGFLLGMEEVGFDVNLFGPMFAIEVRRPDYLMPEKLWQKVNELTTDKHAVVIYEMAESVNYSRALNAISLADANNPFGSLKGREHCGLPIALAGKRRLQEIMEVMVPLLPRFGVDKGALPGKDGLQTYSSVYRVLRERQKKAFEYKRYAGYVDMIHYIQSLSKYHKHHPRELCELYRDEAAAMDAMNQVACNFSRT